jgi:hypothetical protein
MIDGRRGWFVGYSIYGSKGWMAWHITVHALLYRPRISLRLQVHVHLMGE